jgi:hypothetical protein
MTEPEELGLARDALRLARESHQIATDALQAADRLGDELIVARTQATVATHLATRNAALLANQSIAMLSRSTDRSAITSVVSAQYSQLDRTVAVTWIMSGCGVITAVLVALITGIFTLVPKDNPSTAPLVTNCFEQQQGAINRMKENPDIRPIYSGPSEEQCHLNEYLNQWRAAHPPSANTLPSAPPRPTP